MSPARFVYCPCVLLVACTVAASPCMAAKQTDQPLQSDLLREMLSVVDRALDWPDSAKEQFVEALVSPLVEPLCQRPSEYPHLRADLLKSVSLYCATLPSWGDMTESRFLLRLSFARWRSSFLASHLQNLAASRPLVEAELAEATRVAQWMCDDYFTAVPEQVRSRALADFAHHLEQCRQCLLYPEYISAFSQSAHEDVLERWKDTARSMELHPMMDVAEAEFAFERMAEYYDTPAHALTSIERLLGGYSLQRKALGPAYPQCLLDSLDLVRSERASSLSASPPRLSALDLAIRPARHDWVLGHEVGLVLGQLMRHSIGRTPWLPKSMDTLPRNAQRVPSRPPGVNSQRYEVCITPIDQLPRSKLATEYVYVEVDTARDSIELRLRAHRPCWGARTLFPENLGLKALFVDDALSFRLDGQPSRHLDSASLGEASPATAGGQSCEDPDQGLMSGILAAFSVDAGTLAAPPGWPVGSSRAPVVWDPTFDLYGVPVQSAEVCLGATVPSATLAPLQAGLLNPDGGDVASVRWSWHRDEDGLWALSACQLRTRPAALVVGREPLTHEQDYVPLSHETIIEVTTAADPQMGIRDIEVVKSIGGKKATVVSCRLLDCPVDRSYRLRRDYFDLLLHRSRLQGSGEMTVDELRDALRTADRIACAADELDGVQDVALGCRRLVADSYWALGCLDDWWSSLNAYLCAVEQRADGIQLWREAEWAMEKCAEAKLLPELLQSCDWFRLAASKRLPPGGALEIAKAMLASGHPSPAAACSAYAADAGHDPSLRRIADLCTVHALDATADELHSRWGWDVELTEHFRQRAADLAAGLSAANMTGSRDEEHVLETLAARGLLRGVAEGHSNR